MFARGTRIRLPQGTPVRSTNPARRTWVTRRAQVVTVHHTLDAQRHLLAHQHADGRLVFQGSEREQHAVCRRWDLPCDTDAEARASLESLVPLATAELALEGKFTRLWVDQAPARVCWAGSGGYWCEAELALAEAVTPASRSTLRSARG